MTITPDFDSTSAPPGDEWKWIVSVSKAYLVVDDEVIRFGWRRLLSEADQKVAVTWAMMPYGDRAWLYWEINENAEDDYKKQIREKWEADHKRIEKQAEADLAARREARLQRLALRGDEDTEEYRDLKQSLVPPRRAKSKKPELASVKLFRREKARAIKRGALVCPKYYNSSLTRVSGPDSFSGKLSAKRIAYHLWQREERDWGSSPFFHEGRGR